VPLTYFKNNQADPTNTYKAFFRSKTLDVARQRVTGRHNV
jgi:hypothetical protein